MNEKKSLILMATYNGEKYIDKQIESIIKQKYDNWELCISDDGSSDKTLDIIKKYREIDSRILPVIYNDRHGACLNFYNLLRFAKKHIDFYEYYFLSDQDDEWEEDKIILQVEAINKNSIPVMTYSDLRIISEEGVMKEKMSNIQNICLKNPVNIFFNQIYVWGNTIGINRCLLDIIAVPNNISNHLSHDHYISFYAAAFGKVIYIDKPLVRYRRYDNNVSDLPHRYNVLSAIKKIIRKKGQLIDAHARNYNNILYFTKNVPFRNELINDIQKCYENGGIDSFKIIRKYRVSVGSNKYNQWAKILILFLGLYKKSKNFCNGE